MDREDNVEGVASRLRQAMKEKGFKQVDLVKATGIDKGALSNYLAGRYEPKQLAVNKMALALDVSEMWLWGYDVPKTRSKAIKNNDIISDIVVKMRTDSDFLYIAEALYKLDKAKLVAFKQMLDTFL